ncbi:GNAT family N-acetyltransferase [Sphingomonas morindae]|uniref:GNAT family N-acetyltransferase n=1 Tax=Sphingomonas morindae TaxID=1541170 RepID=A0ABY4X3X0_9SPHN|nr:GNAT family N-acetyltransferase [Sphingomonas morindae]USI71587.1 GNAT family N-acetyltransferase [Sphingomonas morindae]
MTPTFEHADTDAALSVCFPIIQQLRPQLRTEAEWCARAAAMRPDGYRVLACRGGDEIIALAGYRLQFNLVHGRFLFVNDLVTADGHRGQGWGSKLLDALATIAVTSECDRLVLDTAMANLDARRFYRREGLQEVIAGFVKPIERAA